MKENDLLSGTTKTETGLTNLSETSKYNGMVRKKFFTVMRNNIFLMLRYMEQNSGSKILLVYIVGLIRIIHLFIPSICIESTIWDKNSMGYKTIMTLRKIFYIIPSTDSVERILWIYITIQIAFIISLVYSSVLYSRNGKLGRVLPYFHQFFILVFVYLAPPMVSLLVSQIICRMTTGTIDVTFSLVIVLFLTLFLIIITQLLHNRIFCISVQFRPDPLMSIENRKVNSITIFVIFITLFCGLGSQRDKSIEIGIYIFCVVLYSFMIYMITNGATLIDEVELKLLISSCLSSIFNILICTSFIILNLKAGESHIFVIIGTFFAIHFITSVFLNKRRNRLISMLDEIEENGIDNNLTLSSILCAIPIGFSISHPVCISWHVFRLMLDKWPDQANVYVIYSKFLSIYPEESQTLGWVQKQIINKNFKGSVCKLIVLQILSILRQREMNLSPLLKRKIQNVMKMVHNAKLKMRNIWDAVIQGNIGEMESVLTKSHEYVLNCQCEFDHLVSQYPNNRFVFRAYCTFLKDVQANIGEYNKWSDSINQLKRGYFIFPDYSHELGVLAFPNLPQTCQQSLSHSFRAGSELNTECEMDIDEDIGNISMDMNRFLRERIFSIVVPGVRDTYYLSTSFVFILIVFPSLILIGYSSVFSNQITEPLSFIYSLSRMRTLNSQLPALSLRLFMEEANISSENTPIFPPIEYGSYIPSYFQNDSSRGQLQFLSKQVPLIVQEINLFRSFRLGDPIYNKIRSLLFSHTINYSYFLSSNNTSYGTVSPSELLISHSFHSMALGMNGQFESKNIDLRLLNMLFNVDKEDNQLNQTLNLMKESFETIHTSNSHLLEKILLIYSIVIIAFYSFTPFMNLLMIRQQKTEVYKCLTYLPKSTVSHILESLKIIKKEGVDTSKSTEDSETNNQEENILRVFYKASEGGLSKVASERLQIISVIIIVSCGITSVSLLISMYNNQSKIIRMTAPHLHFLSSLISGMNQAFSAVMKGSILFSNISLSELSLNSIFHEYDLGMSTLEKDFGNLVFGSELGTEHSFNEVYTIQNSQTYNSQCQKSLVNNEEVYFECNEPIIDIYLIEIIQNRMMSLFEFLNISHEQNERVFPLLWFKGFVVFFDEFLEPLFSNVYNYSSREISSLFSNTIGVSILLLLIAISFQVVIIVAAVNMRAHLVYCLSLLLHCPHGIVTQTPKISAILSGDFEVQNYETTNRDEQFFASLNQCLPDGILAIDVNNNIIMMNKSLQNELGVINNLKGESSHSIINSSLFGPNLDSFWKESFKIEGFHVNIMVNNEKRHLHIHSHKLPNNTTIHSFRNEDQEVSYQHLIEQERHKSDQMLSTILPRILVPRVQAGEKNISFSVQCATIIFIDIVEFTPWCSKNEACTVMDVLNTIFREFDALLNQYSSLTKIKCIGDCYMAAGGIFCEISQPSKHSKESVDFCLDCLSAIEKINQKMNESLKIRIGINTGGPIVCGILGIGKPTFEILGPAINMAQQMEHTGVPMNIQISRTVYELIYSNKYIIKERGEIETKNGKAITYLVSPASQQ